MRSQPTRPSIILIVSGLIVLLAGAIVLFAQLRSNTPAGGTRVAEVTRYPTITPFPLVLPTATSHGPEPTTPIIVPTVAPRLTEYVVQQNDTLWDIAVRFGLTFDAIKAANAGSGFNSDALSLGQVIRIPPSDYVPPPGTIPTSGPIQPQAVPNQSTNSNIGVVLPEAGGLRLRKTPTIDGEVLTKLGPNTQLQLVSEVAGQTWIEVITPNGTRGWVVAQYIAIGGASDIPAVPSSPGDLPINNPTPLPVGPLEYPFLSDMSARVYQIYQAGQARGNRANIVAMIGDSNTQHPAFMKPFDWGNYSLSSYAYLQATVDFFKGSFAREGVAAIGGFNTTKMLDPGSAPGSCGGQSPLQCEYNAIRPSVALILLGTGDQHSWQSFEDRYRQIIQQTIDQGVIPVLITKADDLECRDNSAPCGFINAKIAQLAGEYQVPLLNLRQVVDQLPGRGCIDDGFHYNFPADNKSAWFEPQYLPYGYNQRNLTALQTLDVIRRKVMGR